MAPVAAELEPLAAIELAAPEAEAEFVEVAAAPAEPTSAMAAVETGTPALAPVLPLRRGRRRWLAAAGMLLGAALTSALLFELDRRGLLASFGGSGDAETVAVVPRRSPPPPVTPAPPEATVGDAAVQAAPTSTEPPVPAAKAPAEVATTESPIGPPVELPVELPVEPDAALPVEAPVAAPVETLVEAPVDSAVGPVAAATPAAAAPAEFANGLKPRRSLPEAAARTGRSPLEGSDTIVQLQNGHLFRGRVVRVRDTRLTLRVGSGECVFDLADIALLDATQPEYRREGDMPEASVVLMNGQRLRGRLMKQTPDSVVLMVANGQLVCPRADVREVSFTGRIHF